MRIGVPREIKDHEDRVAVIPAGVRELAAHGHEVLIGGKRYPLVGEMRTMPGLPKHPAAENVDIDFETGQVVGLF